MEYHFPWNHFVFDNFLPAHHLKRLQMSVQNHKDDFLVEQDDDLKINYKFLPDMELAKYFLSGAFKDLLEKTTDLKLTLNPDSLVQLRKMTPDSPRFPSHNDSQDKRSLVCLIYISPNWTSSKGGELILHKQKDSDPSGLESKVINPYANRMILFRSEEHHWHSVNHVNDWVRYSIIMEWLIQD